MTDENREILTWFNKLNPSDKLEIAKKAYLNNQISSSLNEINELRNQIKQCTEQIKNDTKEVKDQEQDQTQTIVQFLTEALNEYTEQLIIESDNVVYFTIGTFNGVIIYGPQKNEIEMKDIHFCILVKNSSKKIEYKNNKIFVNISEDFLHSINFIIEIICEILEHEIINKKMENLSKTYEQFVLLKTNLTNSLETVGQIENILEKSNRLLRNREMQLISDCNSSEKEEGEEGEEKEKEEEKKEGKEKEKIKVFKKNSSKNQTVEELEQEIEERKKLGKSVINWEKRLKKLKL